MIKKLWKNPKNYTYICNIAHDFAILYKIMQAIFPKGRNEVGRKEVGKERRKGDRKDGRNEERYHRLFCRENNIEYLMNYVKLRDP